MHPLEDGADYINDSEVKLGRDKELLNVQDKSFLMESAIVMGTAYFFYNTPIIKLNRSRMQ